MQYDFLKQFPKRMKCVGRFILLIQNSNLKTIWKQCGFMKIDEQINVIFAVMLYIMEQSLKDDICTIDDIGAYIDNLNMTYFHKDIGYEECKELGDFIINIVLCNEGRAMYFDGFDFEKKAYHIQNISYVANSIVYVNSDIKRTSYRLTDDGYNLILSTLEIENNMKLTIHEMIFKMHLEKQSYDQAVSEIKNVFQLLHMQLQKIQDAMGKIRRNALNYTVAEYQEILEENLNTISDTKQKFQTYREVVKTRAKELEEMNLNIHRLDEKEEQNLNNLKIIEDYLNRAIDEHQRILGNHFDLKSLYTHELEQLSQVSSIKRFSFQNDFFDQIMKQPEALGKMDIFFRPLFLNDPEKVYNLKKVTELQRPISRKIIDDEDELMDFGGDDWQKEQERLQKVKLKKYEKSITLLLDKTLANRTVSLEEIAGDINTNQDEKSILIPDTNIFKEIMIDLLRNGEMDIVSLKKERSEFISDSSNAFQLNEMLLNITDSKKYSDITRLMVYRKEDGKVVVIKDVTDELGNSKVIRCSNVQITAMKEEH